MDGLWSSPECMKTSMQSTMGTSRGLRIHHAVSSLYSQSLNIWHVFLCPEMGRGARTHPEVQKTPLSDFSFCLFMQTKSTHSSSSMSTLWQEQGRAFQVRLMFESSRVPTAHFVCVEPLNYSSHTGTWKQTWKKLPNPMTSVAPGVGLGAHLKSSWRLSDS